MVLTVQLQVKVPVDTTRTCLCALSHTATCRSVYQCTDTHRTCPDGCPYRNQYTKPRGHVPMSAHSSVGKGTSTQDHTNTCRNGCSQCTLQAREPVHRNTPKHVSMGVHIGDCRQGYQFTEPPQCTPIPHTRVCHPLCGLVIALLAQLDTLS